MQRILIPTDLTAASNAVFPHALTLAQAFDSKVYLLHVIDPASLREPERLVDFPRLSRFFSLDRQAPDLPPLRARVPVGKINRYGTDPEEAILRCAQRKAVDLICLASTDAAPRPLRRWLSGHITEAVVENASCAVLCLRGQPVRPADWKRPRFRHVLLLLEVSTDGVGTLLNVLPLVQTFNSMLHIFPLFRRRRSLATTADPLRKVVELGAARANLLLFANPARRSRNLMEFMRRTPVDLIAFSPRVRRLMSTPLLSDLLERLLETSRSPVLILR
ncbi:universal stress protein [bacterium]|nr:universal stress protein [bacterium]